MHPAFSVLVFTVMSGAGYGLMTLMIIGHLTGIEVLQQRDLLLTGGSIALVMVTLGLLSSTLHLANPKNAWRAFSRFKTSWLSREAVFAVLFYPFALCYLGSIWLQGSALNAVIMITAVLTGVLAMVTLFCTSMIYASLKTIRQWNSSLTPVNYLMLGLMSGALILLAVQSGFSGSPETLLYAATLALIVIAAVAKSLYLFWIGKPAGSTIQTATGFTQASVRLLDQGHTANSFLNDEFGYQVAADRLLVLRLLMGVGAFVLPFMLLLWLPAVSWLAAVLAIGGLLLERWLFFAEARHVVRLFHGEQRV